MKNQVNNFQNISTKILFVFMLCLTAISASKAQNQLNLIAVFELNGVIVDPNVSETSYHTPGVEFEIKQSGTTLATGAIKYECDWDADDETWDCEYKAYGQLSVPSTTTVSQTFEVPFTVTQGQTSGLSINLSTAGTGLRSFIFTDAMGHTGATGLTLKEIKVDNGNGTTSTLAEKGLTAGFNTKTKAKTSVAFVDGEDGFPSETSKGNFPSTIEVTDHISSNGHAAVEQLSGSNGYINLKVANMPHKAVIMSSYAYVNDYVKNFIVQ